MSVRFRRAARVFGAALLVTAGSPLVPAASAATAATTAPAVAAAVPHTDAAAGLSARALFVENHGQFDPRVRFQAGGHGGSLNVTADGIVVRVAVPDRAASASAPGDLQPSTARNTTFRLSYTDANPNARIEGTRPLITKVSYFTGSNPDDWRTGLPSFGGVRYVDIFPGVDWELLGDGGRYSQRFLVKDTAAGLAALQNTRLIVEGVDGIEFQAGTLRLDTGLGLASLGLAEVVDARTGDSLTPVAGQPAGAASVQAPVTGDGATAAARTHEVIAPFRPAVASQVEPSGAQDLLYSTYLGGSVRDEGVDIAVDSSGIIYVAGNTQSHSDFPITPNAFQKRDLSSVPQFHNVFLAKLQPAGNGQSDLLYASFVGGSGDDLAYGLTIDGSGRMFVAGRTSSYDFPFYNGFQNSLATLIGYDGFIISLNTAGNSLNYSSFIGGSGGDYATDIALDGAGNAYLSGFTMSPPSASVPFPVTPGAYQTTMNAGTFNGFVAKVVPSGRQLSYATYVGGTGGDYANSIAVDGAGSAYVVGVTNSTNFPATSGALQTVAGGNQDGFVLKLNPTGNAAQYATYLGGDTQDGAYGVAVDGSGNAYVAGETQSPNFPVKAGSYDTEYPGGSPDAFVVSLNGSGSALNYGTFLGGSYGDSLRAIALDGSNNAYVTGWSQSVNYPVTGSAFQPVYAGDQDAVLAKFNAGGSQLLYSTYLGGASRDFGAGIAVDDSGVAYLTGWTSSGGTRGAFPTTPGAYDTLYAVGWADAFISKLQPSEATPTPTPTATATPTVTSTPTVTPTYSPTPVGTPALHVYMPLIAKSSSAGW